MTSRYKKSILALLTMLHEARAEPYEKIQKWLTLQKAIIKKLCYVEERIRNCKTEINSLNVRRKNSEIRLTKKESKVVKERIRVLEFHIEEYHWIISIIKSIGDGIAFTFIHKLDIKPQNFKESPGFISGKKGLVLEKKILRHSFKKKTIAILNDITSVLRYADLTLITDDGYIPIEAKSSNNSNSRVKRQEEKTNKLYKYLSEDITSGLYGDSSQVMQRVELGSPEINYINEFNELITSAKQKGFDYAKFEDGFTCLVSFEEVDHSVFESAVTKQGLTEPFAFHLNMYKFEEQGYYPFSLSFSEQNVYWDFLEGKLNVLVFIDFASLKNISLKHGYSMERAEEENWAFSFKSLDPKSEIKEFKMSEHYFFRSFMEFISIEWLMQDTFHRFKNKIKELKRL